MNVLGTAVAWCAVIACGLSVLSEYRGRRERSEAHRREQAAEVQAAYERGRASNLHEVTQIHETLDLVRKERDYWRDMVVRRINET